MGLALSALFALLLGIGVYLVARQWDSVWFLAPISSWQPQAFGWLGHAADVMPSLLHAYAFTMLLILALQPYRHARATGALVWLIVATSMELLQAETFSFLFAGPTDQPSELFLLETIKAYFLNGHFDEGDLWATAYGCIAAYIVTAALEKHT